MASCSNALTVHARGIWFVYMLIRACADVAAGYARSALKVGVLRVWLIPTKFSVVPATMFSIKY